MKSFVSSIALFWNLSFLCDLLSNLFIGRSIVAVVDDQYLSFKYKNLILFKIISFRNCINTFN